VASWLRNCVGADTLKNLLETHLPISSALAANADQILNEFSSWGGVPVVGGAQL